MSNSLPIVQWPVLTCCKQYKWSLLFLHTKKLSISQVAFLKKLELQDGVMIMER
jgi:hypothetical protein